MCDENIEDVEIIKKILEKIKEKQIFCSLIFESNFYVRSYPKVRILEVNDNEFGFRSFVNNACMRDSLQYDQLKELRIETEIEEDINKNEKNNRWQLLDFEA